VPDISLLEPTILRGVVEKLPIKDSYITAGIPRTPWPYPAATWEVHRGSRKVAKPNVPNSEAHIVARIGAEQQAAAFVYLREKKVFEPTTLHWLKAPGSIVNRQRAEEAVMRELTDLNERFDNFFEWCTFQALQGSLVFNYPDVQASVDYKFPASHKPTSAVLWTNAAVTPQQLIEDVAAWKQLVSRDGKVNANTAYLTTATMQNVFQVFAQSGGGSGMLSDRMKDEYYKSGVLQGFMGVDWRIADGTYDTDAGVVTQFLPDGKILFGNYQDGRPIEMYEGPTADDSAPVGFTGKFSKSWKQEDPSARQILLELHALPIITKPEQMLVATVG
jgi:hypothetical protein